MLISYAAVDFQFQKLVRELSDPDPLSRLLAYELFAPPSFGMESYLDQLYDVLDSRFAKGGRFAAIRIRVLVGEPLQPHPTVLESLRAKLGAVTETAKTRVILELHNVDRRDYIGRGALTEDYIKAVEVLINERTSGSSNAMAVMLCTKRRHVGRFPLITLPKGEVSRLERLIKHVVAVKLLSEEKTLVVLHKGAAKSKLSNDYMAKLAGFAGGHPQLIETAVDIALHDANGSHKEHIERMRNDGAAAFAGIWDNTEPRERLVLLAAAFIQCTDLDPRSLPQEGWRKVITEGWGRLEKLSGFVGELRELGIVTVDDEMHPRTFSPLFAIWLVNVAKASALPVDSTIEDVLQEAVAESRPTYMRILEAAMPKVTGEVGKRLGSAFADTVVHHATQALDHLLSATGIG